MGWAMLKVTRDKLLEGIINTWRPLIWRPKCRAFWKKVNYLQATSIILLHIARSC